MSRRFHHQRVEFGAASAFVAEHHRHHTPPAGHLFSIAAYEGERLCGVAIVGRPVARGRQDGFTAEVTRLCTDGTKDACSFLLGCCARAALALGFRRIGTYTLASEGGGVFARRRMASRRRGQRPILEHAFARQDRQASDQRQVALGGCFAMRPTRPLLRYLGSKHRLAPQIASWFPPHDIYLEPYGGSAAVLRNKARCRSETYNDLDGEVVNLFEVLRSDRATELVRLIDLTPYSRLEHARSYEMTDEPVERARRLLVRSHMGHGNNGTPITNKNGWRVDGLSGGTSVVRNWRDFPDSLLVWIDRLRDVHLEQRPALDLIRKFAVPEALIYLDPPYVPETRSASVRWSTGKCSYAHEMSVADHEELLSELVGSPAMIVLSGYRSDLYDRVLTGWRRLELKARAHSNLPRTELVWINPAASQRHGLFAA